jgi:drug/metabolite transporter (DMT)-like permease
MKDPPGGALLHEPITGMLLLGLVLVGTGIYLVNSPGGADRAA